MRIAGSPGHEFCGGLPAVVLDPGKQRFPEISEGNDYGRNEYGERAALLSEEMKGKVTRFLGRAVNLKYH